MPRHAGSLSFVLVTALGLGSIGPAEAQSVERQMLVSVLDRDSQPVMDLQPDDFVVREDGAAREVIRVSQKIPYTSVSPAPVAVMLMVPEE